MKVLVTGFEPFGNETVNPSYEAVKRLPDRIGRAEITKAKIPVTFATSGPVLEEAIKRHQPDIVLCVGQAGGYAGIAVERVAVNLQDASIPDNSGEQPEDQPIVPDGPNAYFSSLPVKEMVKALRKEGIPAFVSNSAGTYVCNHLMYILLHRIHLENRAMRGGFIHVPYSMEQAAGKTSVPPSMELSQIARALEVSIRALL